MSTSPYDPKTEITEYAFQVSPELLGLPLATPLRRGFAILIDLLLASIMTELGSITLSVLIGVLGYRKVRNRTESKGFKTFKNRMISALAGFGFFVLSISIISAFEPESSDNKIISTKMIDSNGNPIDFDLSKLENLKNLKDLENKDSLKNQNLENVLQIVEQALTYQPKTTFSHAEESIDETTISTYLKAVNGQDFQEADSLRPLVAAIVSKPEFTEFRNKIKKLDAQIQKKNDEIESLKEQVDNPSILSIIYALANDFGFVAGWVGLYFIFSLAWFKGQTLGKRVFKIRVIRLNGKPVTVWNSFERFGGYAAGLATGLLGFAQIYWDPNRQAIHDKISGTVVIRTEKNTSQIESN